jgi:hypothetical protein
MVEVAKANGANVVTLRKRDYFFGVDWRATWPPRALLRRSWTLVKLLQRLYSVERKFL